jgi:hypothetical protein
MRPRVDKAYPLKGSGCSFGAELQNCADADLASPPSCGAETCWYWPAKLAGCFPSGLIKSEGLTHTGRNVLFSVSQLGQRHSAGGAEKRRAGLDPGLRQTGQLRIDEIAAPADELALTGVRNRGPQRRIRARRRDSLGSSASSVRARPCCGPSREANISKRTRERSATGLTLGFARVPLRASAGRR